MAARATWKGVLQISLVTIPIKVFPATEASASLSFNQLHDACQTRVSQKRWCGHCAREIPYAEIVKGYEFAKDRYVLVNDDELDALQTPSTHVIDLTQFADARELEPYSIDRSYYVAPAGPAAAEALAVLSIAMRHRVGVGKLAIYGREYLVAVRPTKVPASATYQEVLMLHTLHDAAELRSAESIEELQTGARAPLDQVKLAQQVIAASMGPLDLAPFTDDYRDGVRQLIAAKIAGEEIVAPAIAEPTAVLSLRDALTQSLAAVTASKKPVPKLRMAKATAAPGPEARMTRVTGTVKRLIVDKWFGFVAGPDDREYFFHRTAAPDFQILREGTLVTFTPTESPKGPRAEQVDLA